MLQGNKNPGSCLLWKKHEIAGRVLNRVCRGLNACEDSLRRKEAEKCKALKDLLLLHDEK